MPLQQSSNLLRGGLDLVTPPMVMQAGRAIAALNYEPEARGYRRISGYERFDGRPSPSMAANLADANTRRAAIGKVPGVGPVRGVHVYAGALYAFRDTADGVGAMYRSTETGWQRVFFGHLINFAQAAEEFFEDGVLVGATSNASATIKRVVLRRGAWGGEALTAVGYLVVSDIRGTFVAEEATGSRGGKANILPPDPIGIAAGGHYDFLVHNFYGATKNLRLYAANGVGPAFEFDGTVLSPIRTGSDAGSADDVVAVINRTGDDIVTRTSNRITLRREFDKPSHVGQFSNHLFLSYDAGAIVHSGVGEPLDYRTTTGAGEIGFGVAPTGILSSASTSLVIFGQSRIEYVIGNDSDNFEMKPISDAAGAARWSTQLGGEVPIYLDTAGLRKLSTTSAFGDWRMGTLSQLVEPLIRAKRDAGVQIAASVVAKGKDQYRLFFADGTGLILYLGRKDPEIMPIRMPCAVFCACSGEFREGEGERMFVGSNDGYVYELDRGPSFDGGAVPAYLRLGWNAEKSPMNEKRFQSARIETDSMSAMTIGIAYQVDYSATENLGGARRDHVVPPGSPDWAMADAPYASVDWTMASAGEIRVDDISGLGRNIALTILSEHTNEDPHTLTAMTLFYAPRRQLR